MAEFIYDISVSIFCIIIKIDILFSIFAANTL